MYEDITFQVIMDRMLDRVPDSLDKREGSIIWDALAPAAVEMNLLYSELYVILQETFADTASRERLILRARERGIQPLPATKAVRKGLFTPTTLEIPIGARLNYVTLNYKVLDKTAAGEYRLECETAGTIGNKDSGPLVPIEYISGLQTAMLDPNPLIPGEDEEETEALRARYFANLRSQAFGGNIADYKAKVNALSGVGGVKVYPIPGGIGGTVRLVIIDSSYAVPSSTLVTDVQTTVDPVANGGKGYGIAPIGHVVSVEGVTSTTVNIATTITYSTGWTWADIQPYVNDTIDAYFLELAAAWEDEAALIVRISQIETRLLELTGVIDITGTTINTVASNLTLGADSIPARGAISG